MMNVQMMNVQTTNVEIGMNKEAMMAKALRGNPPRKKDEKPAPITPPGGMPILPGKKRVT